MGIFSTGWGMVQDLGEYSIFFLGGRVTRFISNHLLQISFFLEDRKNSIKITIFKDVIRIKSCTPPTSKSCITLPPVKKGQFFRGFEEKLKQVFCTY